MENIIFRSIVLIVITITSYSRNIHSAPTVSKLNADKLSLLGQQGYEVISKAKEYIAHVSNNLDIAEDAAESSAQSSIIEPDMLVYAKFYVLRKKDLHHSRLPSHAEDTSKLSEGMLRAKFH